MVRRACYWLLLCIGTIVAALGPWSQRPAIGAATQPRFTKHALVIGVTGYQKISNNPLQWADDDARAVAKLLRNLPGDRFNVTLLENDQATRTNILTEIDKLGGAVLSTDLVYVFLAGHSATNKAEEVYFLPYDANPALPADRGITLSEIASTFRKSVAAQRVVFFVDVCASGAAFGEGNPRLQAVDRWRTALENAPNGTFGFASSAGMTRSWEHPKLQHGVFTYYLLEALQGAADGYGGATRDGTITAAEVIGYLSEHVPRFVQDHFRGETQIPVVTPNFTPDFPLTVTAVTTEAPPRLIEPSSSSDTGDIELIRDGIRVFNSLAYFEFGRSTPGADRRANRAMTDLVEIVSPRLVRLRGAVGLELIGTAGAFCLERLINRPADALAAPATPVKDCRRRNAKEQSQIALNLVGSVAGALRNKGVPDSVLRIQTVGETGDEPHYRDAQNAEHWNAIAENSNRVELRLVIGAPAAEAAVGTAAPEAPSERTGVATWGPDPMAMFGLCPPDAFVPPWADPTSSAFWPRVIAFPSTKLIDDPCTATPGSIRHAVANERLMRPQLLVASGATADAAFQFALEGSKAATPSAIKALVLIDPKFSSLSKALALSRSADDYKAVAIYCMRTAEGLFSRDDESIATAICGPLIKLPATWQGQTDGRDLLAAASRRLVRADARGELVPVGTVRVIGVVIDNRAQPVPGIEVVLRNMVTGQATFISQTNATGEYMFDGVASGTYLAEANHREKVIGISNAFATSRYEIIQTVVKLPMAASRLRN